MANILTVVVLDAKGQPTEGAKVLITPSDASGVTNSGGEIQFTLGDAKKYDVTATYGSSKVTVPYYVTENGATRLVVNPVYVKSIENQLHPSFFSSKFFAYAGVGLIAVVALAYAWRFFKRRRL